MVGWKGAAALALLLVALAVYAYQSRPQPQPKAPPLIPCDLLNTVSVRVARADRSVAVQRDGAGGEWRVTEPVQSPADSQSVSYLVSAISAVRVLNSVAKPEAPASYGLDAPSRVVSCHVKDGSSYTLSVGNQSFDSSGYYARKSGDGRVYVISSVEVDEFDRSLKEPPVKPSPI